MNIIALNFVRPVRLPMDPTASFLALDDARYAGVTADVRNNGVVMTVTAKSGGARTCVYVPLSNVSSMTIEPEAPTKK